MATEDLTTFTEVDPNARITVTAAKSAWVNLQDNDVSYVYKDYTAGHFTGSFRHNSEAQMTSSHDGNASVTVWGLADDIGDFGALSAGNTKNSFILVMVANGGNTAPFFQLLEQDVTAGGYGAAGTYYTGIDVVFNTPYYLQMYRDLGVGTYGTLYAYVYSDSGRTTLVDTLTVTLHTSVKNFRYLYVTQTDTATSRYQTGFTQNFDLSASAPSSGRKSHMGLLGVG